MIKRVEVNYRGIFQKNLGKKIGSDIVMIASRMGQKAFSNGRYSDSPERNGIPVQVFRFCFARISPRRNWKRNAAPSSRSTRPTSRSCSTTRCARASSPGDGTACGRSTRGWSRTAVCSWSPIRSRKSCSSSSARSRTITGWRSLTGTPVSPGLWVNKDDLTHERILGGIAAIDPAADQHRGG